MNNNSIQYIARITSTDDPDYRLEVHGDNYRIRNALSQLVNEFRIDRTTAQDASALELESYVQALNRCGSYLRIDLTVDARSTSIKPRLRAAQAALASQYDAAKSHGWLYAQLPDEEYADVRIELLNYVSEYDWVLVGSSGGFLIFRRPPKGTRRGA